MPEPQKGKTLEELQQEGWRDAAESTPGPKMSAGATPVDQPWKTVPPDRVDALGQMKLSTPASEKFMNSPLIEPTGNAILDQFFSPSNLALLAPTAVSALRTAVGELTTNVGTPLAKKLLTLITPSIFKKANQAVDVVNEINQLLKNRSQTPAAPAAPPPQAPTGAPVSGPVSPMSQPGPAAPPPGPAPTGPAPPPGPPPQAPPGAAPQGAPAPPPAAAAPPPQAPPQAPPAPPMAAPEPAPVKPPTPPPPTSASGPQPKSTVVTTPDRYTAALKVFSDLNVVPQRGEVAAATDMAKWGKSIEEAVRAVLAKRAGGAPPVDPAAELARMMGTPSDAEVAASRVRSKR